MSRRWWMLLVPLGFLMAFGTSTVWAGGVRVLSYGRASLEGWRVAVDWEKYEATRINIGSSEAEDEPAYVFDYPGDGIAIDFRNEDFKTEDGFGQGNIANPRPVSDLKAALARARRNVHFQYRIWVSERKEPVGVILTPHQIKATRAGDRIVVKLTDEALTLRDIRIKQ